MASFDINAVARRVQHTVGSSDRDGPYAFSFQVNAASELAVYQNDTLRTEGTHYNSSIGATGAGTITFAGGSYTPTAADVITIIGDQPLSRTTNFQTGQVNQPATLETEFDNVLIRQQQLQEITDRSIQLKPSTGRTVTGSGTSGPLQFPYDSTVANNANRLVKFDSNGTALELGSTTTNIDTLAGKATEIGLLGTSANVTAMGLLGTSAVVADMALLATTDAIADMAILATSDIVSDLNTLATSDIVADLAILATSDIVSDINTLATSDIVSDLNTLATSAIVTDLSILATSDIVTDINLLATSDVVSDLNTLATSDFVSDLNTLASSTVVTNIATVAANVAGVNSFAARYRVTGGDPGSDNDAGDLNYNTSSNALKYWNGSAWTTIASSYSIDTATDTNLTSVADGAMLLYDTGTSKWIDNVMSGDATMADTGAITIANDAITADKIADSINSAITANTAKVTNATHSGEVTGATALTIADNVVDEANLKVSNTPTNGYFLSAQSGNTGGLTWAEATSGSTAVALTGTTDEVDWGAGDIFTHTLTADTTYTFANVPTAAAIDMLFTNFKLAFNTSTTSVGDTFNPTSTTGGSMRAGWLKPDGTKYYITTLAGTTKTIYQFAFSTPFDVSTLSYESKSKAVGSIQSFYIGDDGDYIFFGNTDRTITRNPLGTAYDISTVDLTTTQTLAASVFYNAHNYNSSSAYPTGLWFKSDGSIMYTAIKTLGATDGSQFNIAYYTLSTPWDLSTASAVSGKSVYLGNTNGLYNLALSANGDYILINGVVGDVSRISLYPLTTAFDPKTASNDTVSHIDGSAYNGSISISGMFFNASGTGIIFTCDATDRIVRWELGDPAAFAVTFPSGVTDIRNFFQKSSSGAADKVHLRLLTHNGAANVVIT